MSSTEVMSCGFITILDLQDTATYIYYATNSSGGGASSTPTANSSYIGVYSGKALSKQPDPQNQEDVDAYESIKNDIVWSKYTGPKGDKGDEGKQGTSTRHFQTYSRGNEDLEWWRSKIATLERWSYNQTGTEPSEEDKAKYYNDIQIGDTIYFQNVTSDTKQQCIYYGRVEEIKSTYITAFGTSLTLDGENGTPVTIKSQHYAIGDSGTTAPKPSGSQTDGDIWKTSTDQLTLTQGKYLWTRIIYLSDGEEVTSYSINYIAKDGENGDAYEIRTTSEDLVYFCKRDSEGETTHLESLPSTSIEYAARNKLTGEWVSFEDTSFNGTFKVVFGNNGYDLPNTCYSLTSLGFNGEERECVSLNIGAINDLTYKEVVETGSDANVSLMEKILSDGGYIVYYLTQKGKTLAVKPLLPRYGTSSEMAQFNITATSINQAVNNAYMAFTDTGLELSFKENGLGGYDGGLKISKSVFNPDTEKTEKVPVFYADAEGNLSLTGAITATGGNIGGFRVVDSTLQSVNGGLTLDGENGIISAGTIKLSENAKIEKFINLGEKAVLWNPDHKDSGGLVLQSGGVSIYNNGRITLGNKITISSDGKTGSLSSGIDGSNWRIEDEKAYFKNIDVSGTINTAVFNTDTTQAVGGAMLFMPAHKIKTFTWQSSKIAGTDLAFYFSSQSVVNKLQSNLAQATSVSLIVDNSTTIDLVDLHFDESKGAFCGSTAEKIVSAQGPLKVQLTSGLIMAYTLEDVEFAERPGGNIYVATLDATSDQTLSFDTGGAVWLVKDNSYYNAIIDDIQNFGQTLILSTQGNLDFEPYSLISIGAPSLEPMIMGANSGSNDTANGYVRARGLTISSYGRPESPHLFLGELKSLKRGYSGYGLYCDNVYLNGSLTTIGATTDGKTKYAGVTTLGDLASNKLKEDKSKIVFWAGGTSVMGDADAPFQVTENGSVYAQRAYLEDSVFAKGTITSTTIETACIRGTGKDPGLVIYDTNSVGGIQFKSGYNTDSPQTTMTIKGTSIEVLEKTVIDGTESGIVLSGDVIRTQYNNTGSYIALQMIDNIPTLYHEHSSTNNCGFYFGDGSTAYKIKAATDASPKTKVVFGQETKFIGTVMFAKDEADASFSYKVSDDGGYNLYITSR